MSKVNYGASIVFIVFVVAAVSWINLSGQSFQDEVVNALSEGVEHVWVCRLPLRDNVRSCRQVDGEAVLADVLAGHPDLPPSKAGVAEDSILKVGREEGDALRYSCFRVLRFSGLPEKTFLNEIVASSDCASITSVGPAYLSFRTGGAW